jgi:hypothetical protein
MTGGGVIRLDPCQRRIFSAILEIRFALFGEGSHALFLVLGRKYRMK